MRRNYPNPSSKSSSITNCVLAGFEENNPVVHAWAGAIKSSKSPSKTFPENKFILSELEMGTLSAGIRSKWLIMHRSFYNGNFAMPRPNERQGVITLTENHFMPISSFYIPDFYRVWFFWRFDCRIKWPMFSLPREWSRIEWPNLLVTWWRISRGRKCICSVCWRYSLCSHPNLTKIGSSHFLCRTLQPAHRYGISLLLRLCES